MQNKPISPRMQKLANEHKRIAAMGHQQAEQTLLNMPEDELEPLMKYNKLMTLRKRMEYMTKVRRNRVHTEADFNFLRNEIEQLERDIEEG